MSHEISPSLSSIQGSFAENLQVDVEALRYGNNGTPLTKTDIEQELIRAEHLAAQKKYTEEEIKQQDKKDAIAHRREQNDGSKKQSTENSAANKQQNTKTDTDAAIFEAVESYNYAASNENAGKKTADRVGALLNTNLQYQAASAADAARGNEGSLAFPQGMDQNTVNAKIATLTGGRPLPLQGNQEKGYTVSVSDINAARPDIAKQIDDEQATEMGIAKTKALSAAAQDGYISDKEMAGIDRAAGDQHVHTNTGTPSTRIAENQATLPGWKMSGKNGIIIPTEEQEKRRGYYEMRVGQSGQDTSKPPENAALQCEAALSSPSSPSAEQATDALKQKEIDKAQTSLVASNNRQQARPTHAPGLSMNLSPAPPTMMS